MSVKFKSDIHFRVADVRLNPCPQRLTREPPNLEAKLDVVTHSHPSARFVNQGHNPLLAAAALAHNLHYPLTLCPDAIWLTIASGLAQHIEMNPEECRHHLVDFDGKKKIVHKTNYPDYQAAAADFASQLCSLIKPEAADFFAPNFSTTTPAASVAHNMVLMGALKNYVEYDMRVVCGIPEINLLGTTSDWLQISERVEKLATFGLERWSRALKPVLTQFIEASKGQVDRDFWCGLYKEYRRGNYIGSCGSPKSEPAAVTGWIGLFFPYIHDLPNFQLYTGLKLNELTEAEFAFYKNQFFQEFGLEEKDIAEKDYANDYFTLYTNRLRSFPDGLTEAPVTVNGRDFIFIGGLLGVAQDPLSQAVRPLPGWAVGRRPEPRSGLLGLFRTTAEPLDEPDLKPFEKDLSMGFPLHLHLHLHPQTQVIPRSVM